jgi:hypothetical protein
MPKLRKVDRALKVTGESGWVVSATDVVSREPNLYCIHCGRDVRVAKRRELGASGRPDHFRHVDENLEECEAGTHFKRLRPGRTSSALSIAP